MTDCVCRSDREHSTILVTGLPKGVDLARIESIFSTVGILEPSSL